MSSSEVTSLFNVNGIAALVTGGGSGIGAWMATTLAKNGASKVFIVGRRLEALQQTAKLYPDIIIPIQGDVTSKDSLRAVADRVKAETGYLNLVLANSGISGPRLAAELQDGSASIETVAQKMWETPMEEYAETFNVNITSILYTSIALLTLLDAGNKKGNVSTTSQVIATTSAMGFSRNVQGGIGYITSKAAANHLVKTLSAYFVPYDIRFNALALGGFATDMLTSVLGLTNEQAVTPGVFPKAFIPGARAGNEQDLAGALLYLASPAGAYNYGQIMLVDGGRQNVDPGSTY